MCIGVYVSILQSLVPFDLMMFSVGFKVAYSDGRLFRSIRHEPVLELLLLKELLIWIYESVIAWPVCHWRSNELKSK
ncbi:hypothetical protein M5689_023191 [Euphorbia peplus]|nr:hypothetical protein M5689_023191 [Euphorbia peplus]